MFLTIYEYCQEKIDVGHYWVLKGLSEDNLTDTVVNRFHIRVAGRPFQRKEYPFSKQTDTSGRDLSLPFPEQLKFKAAFD